jgi:hypothetical protein
MSEEMSEVGLKYKKESLSGHAQGLPIVNVWSWLGFPHVPVLRYSLVRLKTSSMLGRQTELLSCWIAVYKRYTDSISSYMDRGNPSFQHSLSCHQYYQHP